MPFPKLVAYIAFGDTPFGTPTFADVSPYICRRVKTKRGRSSAFGEIQAGTATLSLRNTDRRFDPDNTSSPYAPDVLPMKQIAIGATWDAGTGPVTYWIFTGYVESWRMRYEGAGLAWADLVCVDGFEPLSRLRIGTQDTPVTLAQHTTDLRVIDVLDTVGWPAGARTIDPLAALLIREVDLESVPALEHLQLVARSEDGLFFIDREGNAVLQGRGYRDALSTIDTWGDEADGSELPYADLETSYDLEQVFNRVEIQNEDGIEQVDEDATSQSAYLTRTLSRTGLQLVNDTDALSVATEIVTRYKDPKTRARRMRIDPRVRNSWPIVLQRDISDRITVNQRTLLGGSALALDCHIEGVEHDIVIDPEGRHRWDVDWNLSSR